MNFLINSSKFKYILIFPAMAFFVMVFLKSLNSSFTHDESFSYLHYTKQSFMQIISFADWFTNNHILNSLLMKYSAMLFGNAEWALRLPNLLLCALYLIYCIRFFQNYSGFISLPALLLLSSNILLMNLFGLARGYGLSIGFMLMAWYYFMQYLKADRKKDLYFFHLMALLASLSHFSLLLIYLAALILLFPLKYFQRYYSQEKKFNLNEALKTNILPFAFSFLVLYEPVRRVVQYAKLDFGGKNGFIADTVNALAFNTFQLAEFSSSIYSGLQILFIAIPISSAVLIFYQWKRKGKEFYLAYLDFIGITALLFLVSIIMLLQHKILGSDYPIGRFAAFLFPLWMIQFVLLLNLLAELYFRKLTLLFLHAAALASLISFVVRYNFHSYGEWYYDSATKDMMHDLRKEQLLISKDKQMSLGYTWIFDPSIQYYRTRKNFNCLVLKDKPGIVGNEDYLYLSKEEKDTLKFAPYQIIYEYPNANTFLLKKQIK